MNERGFLSTKITVLIFSFLSVTFFLIYYACNIYDMNWFSVLSNFLTLGFYTLLIVYLFLSKHSFKRSVILSMAFACLATQELVDIISYYIFGGSGVYFYSITGYLYEFPVALLAMIFSFVGIRSKGFIVALFGEFFLSIRSNIWLSTDMIGITSRSTIGNWFSGMSSWLFSVMILIFAIHLIPRETSAAPAPVSVTAPSKPTCPTCNTPIGKDATFCPNCGTKVN